MAMLQKCSRPRTGRRAIRRSDAQRRCPPSARSGRRPMIAGTYLGSAGLTVVLAVLLAGGSLSRWSFIALVGATFFLASAGASAAYLTVSEIFPVETRALAIAFFYAVGTGAGGIIGPLLFGNLISSGESAVAVGFGVGAAVMALGGAAELLFGVRAERTPLGNIAKPLTLADASRTQVPTQLEPPDTEPVPQRADALSMRERAEEERARGARHRAAVHEFASANGNGDGHDLAAGQGIEQALADIAELRAKALDERASSEDDHAKALSAGSDAERRAVAARAEAALERARSFDEQAAALEAEHHAEERPHVERAAAGSERARAGEQAALAAEARGRASTLDTAAAAVANPEAALHETWQHMHATRAEAHAQRAAGHVAESDQHEARAEEWHERGLAAEEQLDAARHLAAAEELASEEGAVKRTAQQRAEAVAREQAARQQEVRIRQRLARREQGFRRLSPGPGSTLYSPGMVGTASRWAPTAEGDLEREIDEIVRALDERGRGNTRRTRNARRRALLGAGTFPSSAARGILRGAHPPRFALHLRACTNA
jgi:hypothetical protein